MKTIKIEDKVHKELLKLSVEDGFKRTLSNVIYNKIKPTPSMQFQDITISKQDGKILCYNLIDEILEDYDIDSLKVEMCISLNKIFEDGDINKISFNLILDDKRYKLNCNEFYIEVHYVEDNIICAYIKIENYLNYLKEIKWN